MGIGFETYNDAGYLQISSELMHYYLSAKGTVTLNYNPGDLGNVGQPGGADEYFVPPFEASQIPPGKFIAFSSESPIRGLSSRTYGAVVTYYVFAPYADLQVGQHGEGLQVFNESGGLIYDVRGKPMIVAGQYNMGSIDGSMYRPLNLPMGRQYAAFMPVESYRIDAPLPNPQTAQALPPYNGSTAAFRMINGDVVLSEYPRADYVASSTTNGKITVLDVTGY